jgi:pyroglutamyl-peptidase
MNVLVTGFEPFAGLPHNPSHALLELLPQRLGNHALVKATLPVDTQTAPQHLRRLLLQHQPVAAVHLGLAMGRAVPSLERFALNRLDFEIPDNAGQQMRDQPILPKEPLALETRLPLRAIQWRWTAQKIPSQLSNTAGLYLCNQVMFTSLAWLPESVPSGFIHLPPDETLAAMKAQPYMALQTQARAVQIALEVTLKGLIGGQLDG